MWTNHTNVVYNRSINRLIVHLHMQFVGTIPIAIACTFHMWRRGIVQKWILPIFAIVIHFIRNRSRNCNCNISTNRRWCMDPKETLLRRNYFLAYYSKRSLKIVKLSYKHDDEPRQTANFRSHWINSRKRRFCFQIDSQTKVRFGSAVSWLSLVN